MAPQYNCRTLRRPSLDIIALLSLLLVGATVALWALGATGRLSYRRESPDSQLTVAVKRGAVDIARRQEDPSIAPRPGSLLERATNTRIIETDDVEIRLAGFVYEGVTDPVALIRERHLAVPLWPLALLGTIAPLCWLRRRRRRPDPDQPSGDAIDDVLGGRFVRVGVLVALAAGVALFALRHFTPFLLIAIGLIVLGAGAEALGLSRAARAESRRVRGLCARCGYDVRGSRTRCPECGEVISPYVRPRSGAGERT